MFTKLLSAAAGLILSVTGIASGQDSMTTTFTVRIENITKPDAFTASTGVKWSLGFSPGVVVVHTRTTQLGLSGGTVDAGKSPQYR